MTDNEIVKNITVVAYLSGQVLHEYKKNGNSFPLWYYEAAKAGHKWAGHDINTLREALKLAKKRDDYYISDVLPVVRNDYTDEEMKWVFDLFLEFLDECLGPIDE